MAKDRRGKKAISALVATVLLILITVAAVSVIWASVRLIITNVIPTEACLNARLGIDTISGYTCYDSVKNKVYVAVSRGSEAFNLSGIQFSILSKTGDTKNADTRIKKKQMLVIDDGVHGGFGECGGYSLLQRISALGYNVTIDESVSTKAQIDAYKPDVVGAFGGCWAACSEYTSCTASLLNQLYDAGYSLYTEGNDQENNVLPILATVDTATDTPRIYPDIAVNHYISRGWSSAAGSGSDWRRGVTQININAKSVAKDTTNNFFEAIYLEESGKGKWFHYQPGISIAPDILITNAIEYLTAKIKLYGSESFNVNLPANNEMVTYTVDMNYLHANDSKQIAVAPIIKVGNTEKICDVTSRVDLPRCI